MPKTEYEVAAELRLSGQRQAARGLQGLAGHLRALGSRISSTRAGLGGITRQIAGMAAAYVGFRAIQHGLGGMVRTAVSFNQELETTRIGLQSVIAATSGGALTFEQAGETAGQVFRELTDDAIASTATTSELFSIYQSIVGPIRNAGFALGDVREITNSTVAAASALGVDFQQASRDISQMVRGAAGMDVRLFSMLRSTGAIAQSTEEWNRNMTTPQRVEALRTALSQFAPAAEAYGRTWAGLTSSLRDLYEQFLAALAGPAIRRIKGFMQGVVQRLVANRDQITAVLTAAGERIAGVLGQVFDRANAGIEFVTQHWDQIVDRVREVVAQVRAMIPQLLQAAKVFAGLEIARMAAGPGLQAAGGAAQLGGQLGGLLGAGAGGGAAGAAAAGETGAGGALAAAGAGLAPVLGILAAAFAAIVGVGMVVVELWDQLVIAFEFAQPLLEGLWTDLQGLGLALWEILRPLLRLIGGGWFIILAGMLVALVVAARLLIAALRFLLEPLTWIAGALEEYVVDPFLDAIGEIAIAVGGLLGLAEEAVHLRERAQVTPTAAAGTETIEDPLAYLEQRYGRGEGPAFGQFDPLAGGATMQRPIVHNDFRGSRIQVRQEYRQADPDRIAIQMIEDIQRQAESRVQSGYVPALTR